LPFRGFRLGGKWRLRYTIGSKIVPVSRLFQFGAAMLAIVLVAIATVNLMPFGVAFDPVPMATGHLPDSPAANDQRVTRAEWEPASGPLAQPEDIVADASGALFVGTSDGLIMRRAAQADEWTVFAEVGGRPLGLFLDHDGTLLVANNSLGVQRVFSDGTVDLIADTVNGEKIGLPNGVVSDAEGMIYVTDSSTRYNRGTLGPQPTYALPDLLEGRAYGRLIRIDPATGDTEMVTDGLYFPNSLVLAPDRRSVILAESSRFRLLRVWVEGPEAGQTDVLIDALPGNPDGLDYDAEGRLLLTLYDHVEALNTLILPYGFSRRILMSLPRAWFVNNDLSGFVAVIDPDSFEIVRVLRDASGFSPSNVVQVGNVLYSGTLVGDRVVQAPYP
jgi:sugar lactone lactonase YvrE